MNTNQIDVNAIYLYHITHIENLPKIIEGEGLLAKSELQKHSINTSILQMMEFNHSEVESKFPVALLVFFTTICHFIFAIDHPCFIQFMKIML